MYIICSNCKHTEKTDKDFFVKLIGGAAPLGGFWAWTTYLFAGTGFAAAIVVAIIVGGVGMLIFKDEVVEWIINQDYQCPKCGEVKWKALNSPEDNLEEEGAKKIDAEDQILLAEKKGDLECAPGGRNNALEDNRAAFELFQKAEQGDISAQLQLGSIYIQEHQGSAQAAIWFQKAAEQGDSFAEFALASLYLEGRGLMQDHKEAVKWLKIAAEKGDAISQGALGGLYAEGKVVAKDYKQAALFLWRSIKSESNFPESAFWSLVDDKNDDLPQKVKDGLQKFQELQQVASHNCMTALGCMYIEGLGVKQNYKKAAMLLKKAAKLGNDIAQSSLGIMYYDGAGVPEDYKESARWFKKSAEQGNVVAQSYLGRMYYEGEGVSEDYKQAAMWFQKAADECNKLA